jgi:16S rRNA (adenine1518-N6/adenine1519-N6)-dimethyltransferase
MVQKEFAERLCAKKGGADYSSLTMLCSYYASVKKLFSVPAGCFTPRPKVDSAVIRLDLYDSPAATPKNEKLFLELIRSAFAYRRKTLFNCVCGTHGTQFSKQEIALAFDKAGLAPTVRGEELDIHDLCRLADALS